MQKSLTSMNVPLANAISDISGVSGQAHYPVDSGWRAGHAKTSPVARPSHQSQRGGSGTKPGGETGRKINCFELQQAVDEYDFRQKQISECDRKLQAYLAVLPSRPIPAGDTGNVIAPAIAQEKGEAGRRRQGAETPRSPSICRELKRVTG